MESLLVSLENSMAKPSTISQAIWQDKALCGKWTFTGWTVVQPQANYSCGEPKKEQPGPEAIREARSPASPPPEKRSVVVEHRLERSWSKLPHQDTQTRSRLVIGDFGPSDSALAAGRVGRLRRPAADRHAARCASRDLCSGGAPRLYTPSSGWGGIVDGGWRRTGPFTVSLWYGTRSLQAG